MVKHTQTIGRQQPTNCLGVFNHFVLFTFKGLKFLRAFRIVDLNYSRANVIRGS